MEQYISLPTQDYMVVIKCYTYNHESYIEDALKGFVMQKTDFPFCAIVVDDFSTDSTADIIRKYENDYPNIIKGVYLNENYHSQHKPKLPLIQPWFDRAKYTALCEGDDYWIDPLKLQKQVDYMENHSDCTMTCSRTKLYSIRKNRFVSEQYCKKGDGVLNVKDVIYRQGLYISTCSVVYKSDIKSDYPVYCGKCLIGDYPLQIYAAIKGNIYYFDDVMSVYRVENNNSWMGKQASLRGTIDEKRLVIMDSTIDMLVGFSNDYPSYKELFYNKICEYINRGVPYRKKSSRSDVILYIEHYKSFINQYNMFWKLDLLIRRCRIPGFRSLYTRLFTKRFFEKRKAICFA